MSQPSNVRPPPCFCFSISATNILPGWTGRMRLSCQTHSGFIRKPLLTLTFVFFLLSSSFWSSIFTHFVSSSVYCIPRQLIGHVSDLLRICTIFYSLRGRNNVTKILKSSPILMHIGPRPSCQFCTLSVQCALYMFSMCSRVRCRRVKI